MSSPEHSGVDAQTQMAVSLPALPAGTRAAGSDERLVASGAITSRPAPNVAGLEQPAEFEPILPRTTAEIHRAVWSLAWPSVATMLLQTFNSLMDVFFVGHLPYGAAALAATGVGGNVMFLLLALSMGVGVGTTALVARFTGAEDRASAVRATAQSVALSAVMSVAIGVLFYSARGTLANAMLDGARSPVAAHLCVRFLSVALLATVPVFVLNALQAAFRGLGDTRTPMYVTLAMIATHMSLDAVLIYGLLGAPRLGIVGAGTALATSLYVGAISYALALRFRSPLRDALQPRQLRLEAAWSLRILRIGAPAAVQAVLRTIAMMSFIGVLARAAEHASAVAALQIGVRAEAVAFMPGFGYSVAAAALVGQNLGAGDPEHAERCGWAATWQAIGTMSFMAVLFFLFATPFARLVTADGSVVYLGADYLRVNAFGEPFLALGMVLTGALQGAGDTIRPTFVTVFTMWIVRLPLAYWLMFSRGLQTHGAWISMTASTVAGGLMMLGLFRSGKWKNVRV